MILSPKTLALSPQTRRMRWVEEKGTSVSIKKVHLCIAEKTFASNIASMTKSSKSWTKLDAKESLAVSPIMGRFVRKIQGAELKV